MVHEILEQCPMNGERRAGLADDIGEKFLGGAARCLLAKTLLNVGTDDFRDGESVLANLGLGHERTRGFEAIEGNFERRLGGDFDAAAEPAPESEKESGDNYAADKISSPEPLVGNGDGTANVVDVPGVGGGWRSGRSGSGELAGGSYGRWSWCGRHSRWCVGGVACGEMDGAGRRSLGERGPGDNAENLRY